MFLIFYIVLFFLLLKGNKPQLFTIIISSCALDRESYSDDGETLINLKKMASTLSENFVYDMQNYLYGHVALYG